MRAFFSKASQTVSRLRGKPCTDNSIDGESTRDRTNPSTPTDLATPRQAYSTKCDQKLMETVLQCSPTIKAHHTQLSINTDSNVDDIKLDADDKEDVSILFILAMTCQSICIGYSCSVFSMIVVPAEASYLFPNTKFIGFGMMLITIGVASLYGPLAGNLSDTLESKFGRRRPYLGFYALLWLSAVMAMYLTSYYQLPLCYVATLFFGSLCHQAIDTVSKGLIADLVPLEKQSIASAICIFWASLGAVFGLVIQLVMTQHHTKEAYFIFMAMVVISTSIMFAVVSEKSSIPTFETRLQNAVIHGIESIDTPRSTIETQALVATNQIGQQGFLATIKFAKKVSCSREDRDFMLCFWSRVAWYYAVSVAGFFFFYLRDVIQMTNEDERKAFVSELSLVGQMTGLLTALPVGFACHNNYLSMKTGTYLGCVAMMLTMVFFPLSSVGHLWPDTFPMSWQTCILVGAVFFGIGQGCYGVAELAITLRTIRSDAESARYLGLWSLGYFIGACAGPTIMGAVLQVMGEHPIVGYAGFLFPSGFILSGIAGYLVLKVQCVEPEDGGPDYALVGLSPLPSPSRKV